MRGEEDSLPVAFFSGNRTFQPLPPCTPTCKSKSYEPSLCHGLIPRKSLAIRNGGLLPKALSWVHRYLGVGLMSEQNGGSLKQEDGDINTVTIKVAISKYNLQFHHIPGLDLQCF